MAKKLTRSRTDRRIAGICGGLAEYFNIDVTVIRIIVAISSIITFSTTLWIYILGILIIPLESYQKSRHYTYYQTYQKTNTRKDVTPTKDDF
ncbi:PspC domain-containing protein [Granulicatella sp. zg-ZJ]|uniref:PspC domain-containing protein n=1 Tax=unclassified Granulicatella TaxID=2630493 RepID=UPI0013BEDB44|nr:MULTISPECIES: PspC domain-containing protein [unclassified Granulicatella]NEW63340.1 PspC domain-containing protein [Granulicatella sp. zg-ZJ]NEW65682.1 PspC domain-containing protein [Granulicatella sp. zg-84]